MRKGSKHSPETAAKMRGRQVSAETRARLSQAHKGKPATDQQRLCLLIGGTTNRGRQFSPEHRLKLSLAKKGKRLPHMSRPLPAERQAAMVAAARTPEARLRNANRKREEWAARPAEQVRAHMDKMWRALSAGPSSLERTIAAVLSGLGVAFETQVAFGRYRVDFLIRSKALVIECDGSRWHADPAVRAKDARRDAFLQSEGYRVLRLP